LGSQPGVKSRRIFCSSAPQIWAKGPVGKKYLPINKVEDYEKIFE
jgi:hypothetical protein